MFQLSQIQSVKLKMFPILVSNFCHFELFTPSPKNQEIVFTTQTPLQKIEKKFFFCQRHFCNNNKNNNKNNNRDRCICICIREQ